MKIAKNFLQILKNWGTETPQQTIISTSGHSLWLFKRLCSGPKTTDDIGPRKSYIQMNFQVSFSYLLNCTFLNYGFVDVYGKKHKILWHDEDGDFPGIPFAILSQKYFDCQHGIDRNKAAKIKQRKQMEKKAVS